MLMIQASALSYATVRRMRLVMYAWELQAMARTISPSCRVVPEELMSISIGSVAPCFSRYNSSATISSVTAGTSYICCNGRVSNRHDDKRPMSGCLELSIIAACMPRVRCLTGIPRYTMRLSNNMDGRSGGGGLRRS